MKKVLLLITGFLLSQLAIAQLSPNGQAVKALKEARKLYDEGKIELVVEKLSDKLENFEVLSEKLEAHELVMESWLQMNRTPKADTLVSNVLKIKPFFESDTLIRSAEYTNLYKPYRRYPVWSIGLVAGGNMTMVDRWQTISVESNQNTGTYSSVFGFQAGLNIAYSLTDRSKLRTSILYNTNNIQFQNEMYDYTDLLYTETQASGTMSLEYLYNFRKWSVHKKTNYYLFAGMEGKYLLSAIVPEVTRSHLEGEESPVQMFEEDVTPQRTPMTLAAIGGGGIKFKMGTSFISLEAKYTYGLSNITNTDVTYSNKDMYFEAANLNDVMSLNAITFNVGYHMTFYKPKKLKRLMK